MRGARSRGPIVVSGPSMPSVCVGALSQSPRVSRIVSSKGSLDPSVRPSVRPSDFAFNLLALRPQTSSKRRFVPWSLLCQEIARDPIPIERILSRVTRGVSPRDPRDSADLSLAETLTRAINFSAPARARDQKPLLKFESRWRVGADTLRLNRI